MHLAKQIVLSLEFSTQHRKQLVLEKRIKELEHDKESLQSDFEAAQGSVDLMRDMVEKSRKEYLSQVQETIKTEILMGQAVNTLDSEVVELRSKIINLEAETSSLRQAGVECVAKGLVKLTPLVLLPPKYLICLLWYSESCSYGRKGDQICQLYHEIVSWGCIILPCTPPALVLPGCIRTRFPLHLLSLLCLRHPRLLLLLPLSSTRLRWCSTSSFLRNLCLCHYVRHRASPDLRKGAGI